jgi:protein-S-isoprenylcysteine O-methyltransferase Ste14
MLWLRLLLFVVVVPGTTLVWVPQLLLDAWPQRVNVGAARWLGMIVAGLGAALMVWCFRDFVTRGRGTPAPIDPPRALVVGGPYRMVRNPMYVGAVAVILGQALWFGAPVLVVYAMVFLLAAHLFVVGYEERTLARRFGAAYSEYLRTVPRWLPRSGRTVSSGS